MVQIDLLFTMYVRTGIATKAMQTFTSSRKTFKPEPQKPASVSSNQSSQQPIDQTAQQVPKQVQGTTQSALAEGLAKG
ncbi:hypothetical protein, partial [Oryzifoliimicrobium ureilyticus]|uniref:hypothetical protein n=1 Tax=Oryzifoliimicrobium ureilyticus TaxID=3113724 RepID=UPI0030763596